MAASGLSPWAPAPASAQGAPDVTPPSVSFTSPTNGATLPVGQLVILTATASDNVGVGTVRFVVDGWVHAIDAQSPYQAPWGTVAGIHVIDAIATDAAGNTASARVVVSVAATVDTAPPAVTLTAPTAGTTAIRGQLLTLAANASDASGILRVEFLVDDVLAGSDSTSPYAYVWTAIAGSHTVSVRAIDASDRKNSATSPRIGLTVVAPNGVANCGDGILQLGYQVASKWGVSYYEQCDDRNTRTNDGCDAYCQREFCGDGLVQPGIGEVCDATVTACEAPGGYPGTRACRSECTGFVTSCTTPLACGDGICTAGAESVASCPGDCPELCGDGVRSGAEACDDGNLTSLDGCSAECTLDTNEASRLPVVLIVDGDQDGWDNDDVLAGLTRCAPGCILRAPAATFRGVNVEIPAAITNGLILEGAGIDQTIFRAPVPLPQWGLSAGFRVTYPNRLTVFRDFTIDGRKAEQPSLPSADSQYGISVSNGRAVSTGPGRVERVRIRNMLTGGVGITYGENWVIAHSAIEEIGCSDRLACPALPATLRDPDVPEWQTPGFGIITVGAQARGALAHHNTISNVVKIGIEAIGSGTALARDFTFRDNRIYNTGSGIVSNGGEYGTIAANLIEAAHSSGISCGGAAGQLVIDRNLLRGSHVYSMALYCDGEGLSLSRNRTLKSCPIARGGNDVLVQSSLVYGSGSGLQLLGNVFGGGSCGSTLLIRGRSDIVMDGTTLHKGRRSGLVLMDVQRMAISNTLINGTHPVGVLIYQNVHDVTGQLTIRNAERPVVLLDPASTSGIDLRY